jgi:FlaA1/EpsC-like NDP-sugar epimerase
MAEYGETFVLDMGEPVRIVDLVHRYAEQLRVPDVKIRFTGLRPGEKLHETLFGAREERLRTVNPAVWATRPARLPDDFHARLYELYAAAAEGQSERVRDVLASLMPDYAPAAANSMELASAILSPYPDEF